MATPNVIRQPAGPVSEPDYFNVSKGLKSWLLTLDHKRIGLMYLFGILGSLLVGGAFLLIVASEPVPVEMLQLIAKLKKPKQPGS